MKPRHLDRIRQILAGERGAGRAAPPLAPAPAEPVTRGRTLERAARELDGLLAPGESGGAVVVDRRYEPSHGYGGCRLDEYPTPCRTGLAVLAGRRPEHAAPPDDVLRGVTCFDLETTGLSGGAGTVAWVVGLGWFAAGGFETRQYVLGSPTAERQVLGLLTKSLRRCHTLVTFNGRSFDGPLIDTRYAFHRLSSPLDRLAHVDMLHPSRHLWSGDEGRLVSLERDVLGLHRVGDVPGSEIPGRYHAFLRSADAGPVAPVLEHNRLDLVSLGVLTGLASALVRSRGKSTCGPAQALGLGRLYERVGQVDEAVHCYRRAAGMEPDATSRVGTLRRSAQADRDAGVQALGRLGTLYRRLECHADAAAVWTRLLSAPRVPPRLRREASVALAVHHEHRDQDLAAAHRFATEALREAPQGRPRQAVEHRVRRLNRKIETRGRGWW